MITKTHPNHRLGATPLSDGSCCFRVWAPRARRVEVRLRHSEGGRVHGGGIRAGDASTEDADRLEALAHEGDGYHACILKNVEPGARYVFRLDGELERPDPASRLQSDGVHGPSRVIDLGRAWQDGGWRGLPLHSYVMYELHVGAFSHAGTFAGVASELRRLKDLGITAIELMPVAQFPGTRNWGYDGVYPFAVQDSYGGPKALQRLVDECHRLGLAVVLDVVYNHLGPEGNYLGDYGPYFTERYQTPWGRALNFDGPQCEGVRAFFMQNALMWLDEFHIDALRLDAVHAIIDRSAKPFLEELADAVHRRGTELGRLLHLIAESDLNDARIVRPSALGGHGLDAMWCDDFHHAAHVLLTGEQGGYYADYGRVGHLAEAFRSGMTNAGGYSEFRQRRHGRPAPDLKPAQAVVCLQNHDQIGNRRTGERLSGMLGFEQLKLAAGLLCLSPFIPLLFMGEEYGETAPFQYFVDHGDDRLIESIRRGRRAEFDGFASSEEAPDPAAPETLEHCRLNPQMRHSAQHSLLYHFYEILIRLRPRLVQADRDETISFEAQRVLFVCRDSRVWMAFSFSPHVERLALPIPLGSWQRLVDSADLHWQGPGTELPVSFDSNGAFSLELQPYSFVCYATSVISTPRPC